MPVRKVSLVHTDCTFNCKIGADFFYWLRNQDGVVLCLHAMCIRTSLSEAKPVESRKMSPITAAVESLWTHQCDRPLAIGFDPEFNKAEFLAMLKWNGILANPRPARRHKKMDPAERKHRVIKLLLSILAHVLPQASSILLVKFTTFLSDVLYGDQLLRPFELALEYKPSLTDTKLLTVPQDLIKALKK